MDWYPWFFQIYKADTMHLDPYQDGCYRRLIDHYMETRQPLPDNDYALARIVGDSHPNWVAMASAMVRPFFKARGGLLFHTKCDEILNHQDIKTNKLSESGKKGAKKRWSKINHIDSHPIAYPIAYPMGYPIAEERRGYKKKNIPEGISKKVLKPEDVCEQTWQDFIAHRKAKKATITQTVIRGFRREAEKAGFTLEKALVHAMTQGWQGFRAEWVKQPAKGTQNHAKSKSDIADEAAERAFKRLTGEDSPFDKLGAPELRSVQHVRSRPEGD